MVCTAFITIINQKKKGEVKFYEFESERAARAKAQAEAEAQIAGLTGFALTSVVMLFNIIFH